MKAKERDEMLTLFFNSMKGGAGGNPYYRPEFEAELKAVSAAERNQMAKELVELEKNVEVDQPEMT